MKPNTFILLIAFFFAGSTCVLVTVGMALLMPGTPLDLIWQLNEAKHAVLAVHGQLFGLGFLLLAISMAAASIGCFMRRVWGWWLAVIIFALNGLGDATQLLMGHVMEGAVGVAVALAVLFYLTRPHVRAAFG